MPTAQDFLQGCCTLLSRVWVLPGLNNTILHHFYYVYLNYAFKYATLLLTASNHSTSPLCLMIFHSNGLSLFIDVTGLQVSANKLHSQLSYGMTYFTRPSGMGSTGQPWYGRSCIGINLLS